MRFIKEQFWLCFCENGGVEIGEKREVFCISILNFLELWQNETLVSQSKKELIRAIVRGERNMPVTSQKSRESTLGKSEDSSAVGGHARRGFVKFQEFAEETAKGTESGW